MLYNSEEFAAPTVEQLAAALIRMSGPLDIEEGFDEYLDVDTARLSTVLRSPDDMAALCNDLNSIFVAEGKTLFAEPASALQKRMIRGMLRHNEEAFVVRPHEAAPEDKDALDQYETDSRYYAALLDGVAFAGNPGLKALRATEKELALEKQMTDLAHSYADERSKALSGIYRRLKLAATQVADKDTLALLKLVDGTLSTDRWLHSTATLEQQAATTDDCKQSRNKILDEAEGRLYALARRLNLSLAELWLHSSIDLLVPPVG